MGRILLMPFGSSGDVNPFVGMGLELKRRGHEAIVITNPHFEKMVRDAGLEFAPMGSVEDYERVTTHPDMWDAKKSIAVFLKVCLALVPDGFERMRELYQVGSTVLVAPVQAYAAPFAHTKLGIPLVRAIPNPWLLRSAYRPPKSPFANIPDWLPAWAVRHIFKTIDRKLEPLFTDPIREYCERFQIPPVPNPLEWTLLTATRILALWPDWYAATQRDWPPNAVTTGFIEYDGTSTLELQAFEEPSGPDLGAKPIVFTLGTAMAQGEDFFACATAACEALDRPGLLLTQRPDQLPELGPRVRHVSYAPLGDLLPKVSAIVHHGGVGTSARGLKAGIPQLIIPMAYDQFDNAYLLSKLGVAESIPRTELDTGKMTAALTRLTESRQVADNCKTYASRAAGSDGLAKACDLIESLV